MIRSKGLFKREKGRAEICKGDSQMGRSGTVPAQERGGGACAKALRLRRSVAYWMDSQASVARAQ